MIMFHICNMTQCAKINIPLVILTGLLTAGGLIIFIYSFYYEVGCITYNVSP